MTIEILKYQMAMYKLLNCHAFDGDNYSSSFIADKQFSEKNLIFSRLPRNFYFETSPKIENPFAFFCLQLILVVFQKKEQFEGTGLALEPLSAALSYRDANFTCGCYQHQSSALYGVVALTSAVRLDPRSSETRHHRHSLYEATWTSD